MKPTLNFKKKLKIIFNSHPLVSSLILLLGLSLLSSGQLLNQFFFGEDWNLMFKLAHMERPFAGLAPGLIGEGTYKYFQTWYYPIYSLFKLNPFPYFLVTLILYYISTVSIYLFSYELSRKRAFAFLCAALFNSMGYIGSQTFINLYTSYPIYISIILTSLTSFFLLKYYHLNKLRFYFLSIIFFYSAMEFVNFRSHEIILIVLGISILFSVWKLNFNKILFQILKIMPFILLYVHKYGEYAGSSDLLVYFFNAMSPAGSFGYVINPFGTFGNILVPEVFSRGLFTYLSKTFLLKDQEIILLGVFSVLYVVFAIKNNKRRFLYLFFIVLSAAYLFLTQWVISFPLFWKVTEFNIFVSFLGFSLFLTCLSVVNSLWNKKNLEARIILLGIFWIFVQYATYFVFILQDSLLPSEHKYIKIASVGSIFILTGIISQLRIKKINLPVITAVIIIASHLILINALLYDAKRQYSDPAQKIYSEIQAKAPDISDSSKIILDVENRGGLRTLANNIFAPLGLSIYYNLDDALYTTFSLEELIPDLINKKISINDLIGIHVEPNKVTNTTPLLKDLLTERKIISSFSSGWESNLGEDEKGTFLFKGTEGTAGVNPIFTIDIDHPILVPSLASITMSVSPKILEENQFPYKDSTEEVFDINEQSQFSDLFEEGKIDRYYCDNRVQYINTQSSRNNFSKVARISAGTPGSLKDAGVLADGKAETAWIGIAEEWQKKKNVEILIDLGREEVVKRVIWMNYSERFSPKKYNIYASSNFENWKIVKSVENGQRKLTEEITTETIAPISARYLKMVILGTVAEYPPGMAEIWVDALEGNYASSIDDAEKIATCPFCCPVNTKEEEEKIVSLLAENAKAKIWWTSNSIPDFIPRNSRFINLIPDGNYHTYEIYIPSEGTRLWQIRIDGFQFPVNVRMQNIKLQTLTLDEIKSVRQDLVK